MNYNTAIYIRFMGQNNPVAFVTTDLAWKLHLKGVGYWVYRDIVLTGGSMIVESIDDLN